jgi:hypothetical protein
MCCRIPEAQRAQKAPFFPPGWTFLFDSTQEPHFFNPALARELDGLVILSPDGRRYRSVEGVLSKHTKLRDLVPSPQCFYVHVGIHITSDDTKELQATKRQRTTKTDASGPSKRRKGTSDNPIELDTTDSPSVASSLPTTPSRGLSLTPTELYKRRCRNCLMCTKADCSKCATCVLNASRTRRNKEVCLRKVSTFRSRAFTLDVYHHSFWRFTFWK